MTSDGKLNITLLRMDKEWEAQGHTGYLALPHDTILDLDYAEGDFLRLIPNEDGSWTMVNMSSTDAYPEEL